MGPIGKGIAAGLGIGGTAMYLGNEGQGQTFTSYPRDARYKQLMRGDQIPLPGLEDHVSKNYGEWSSGPIDKAPDGSPDARRESTWLGVAAKAALIAGMAAPFVGPAIRGGMALGKGVQGAYAAGGMKGIGQTIAGAGKFQAGRAADAGRAAMGDPRAAMAAAGQGIVGGAGRLGRTYKDFYAGGGAGRELNRARSYFGM